MEREKIITTLEDIADDLGVVCVNELDHELWHYYGWQLWDKLNSNKVLLLNYLESEYQAGHRISPLIIVLRERMEKAISKIYPAPFEPGFGDEIYSEFYDIANVLIDWLNWVNRYYPPEQSTQELSQDPIKQKQNNEEPVKQDNKPKRISAAAKKLATPELQAVKQKLVDAGLIKDGKWTGIAAEFGFLVTELSYTHYVNNGERKAWIECANWAGYDGNIQSARKGIEQHPDMETPITDIIRDACKK